jgi:hypothetical protein
MGVLYKNSSRRFEFRENRCSDRTLLRDVNEYLPVFYPTFVVDLCGIRYRGLQIMLLRICFMKVGAGKAHTLILVSPNISKENDVLRVCVRTLRHGIHHWNHFVSKKRLA